MFPPFPPRGCHFFALRKFRCKLIPFSLSCSFSRRETFQSKLLSLAQGWKENHCSKMLKCIKFRGENGTFEICHSAEMERAEKKNSGKIEDSDVRGQGRHGKWWRRSSFFPVLFGEHFLVHLGFQSSDYYVRRHPLAAQFARFFSAHFNPCNGIFTAVKL